MEWLPISSAPKDGKNILLLSLAHIEDYHTAITVGFWGTPDAYGEDPREAWCDWCAGFDGEEYWVEVTPLPTHWMPLPPPPVQATEAGTAETGTGSVHEGAVGNADAPVTCGEQGNE